MENIVNNILKALLAIILVFGICDTGLAQNDIDEPEQKTIIFRFQSQTVVEDWVKLVEELKRQGFALEDLEIPVSSQSARLTEASFAKLRNAHIPENLLKDLESLKNKVFFDKNALLEAVKKQITAEQTIRYKDPILAHAIKSPTNSLCTIYKNIFNLPGCPLAWEKFALDIAEMKDPKKILYPGDRIKVPNLPPLKEFEWTLLPDPNDEKFEKRWGEYIKDKIEVRSMTVLIMKGWELELPFTAFKELNFEITPETLHRLELEKVPNTVVNSLQFLQDQKFQGEEAFSEQLSAMGSMTNYQQELVLKHASFPPIVDTWQNLKLKDTIVILPETTVDVPLYSNPLEDYYAACKKYQVPEEHKSYSLLLGVEKIRPKPQPEKKCVGGSCPKIILLDTSVYKHPDLGEAIDQKAFDDGGAREGPIRDGLPQNVSCPEEIFDNLTPNHHGTHLAGIMVGRKHFLGLAQNVILRPYNYAKLKSSGRKLLDLISDSIGWNDCTPVFVFASDFHFIPEDDEPEHIDPAGVLDKPATRLKYPNFAEKLINAWNVLWVVAVGQNKTRPGYNISIQSKRSPVNLGDHGNILVVTACEKCDDKVNAKVWDKAHSSTVQRDGLVHVAAPGGDPIPGITDGGGYFADVGTSPAAAYVGGVVAEMIAYYPDFYDDPFDIKKRIQVTAHPFYNLTDREKVTGGIIDLRRAFLSPEYDWLLERDECKELVEELQIEQEPLGGKFEWRESNMLWADGTPGITFKVGDSEPKGIPLKKILRIKSWGKSAHDQCEWIIFKEPEKIDDVNTGTVERLGPGTIEYLSEGTVIGTFTPEQGNPRDLQLVDIQDLLIKMSQN